MSVADIKATCSFCDKNNQQVAHIIIGPHNVCICDECIALCVAVVREQKEKRVASNEEAAPIGGKPLRPTGLSSPAYHGWIDYIVLADGRAVGRI